MTNIRESAETSAVRAAEQAADDVHRYIENALPGEGATVQAYATLALAASVDALREALTSRLDDVADAVVTELREG